MKKSQPGYKTSKDRLTFWLGGNAEGDFKLKSILFYYSLDPHALKGLDKSNLPVIWKATKKA